MQEFHQFLGKSTPNQGGNEPSPPDILGEYLNRSRAVLNESKVPREQFGHSSTSYVAVSGLFPAASVSSIITTAASCRRPELSTGAGLHLLKVTAPELQGFPSDYFAGVSQVQGDYDSTVYAVLRSQAAESSATSAVERLLQGRTEQRIDRLLTTTNEPTTISPALLSVIQQVTEEESRLKSDPQRLAALNQQQHNNSLPPLPQLNSLVSSIGLTNDNPAATLDAHADPIISRMGRSGRQSISSFDDSHSLEDIGANDESPEDIYGRVIKGEEFIDTFFLRML